MDLFDDLPAPGTTNCNSDTLTTISSPNEEEKSFSNSSNHATKRSNSKSTTDFSPPAEKRILIQLLPLVSGSCARKGERDEMQDAHVVLDNFKDLCSTSDFLDVVGGGGSQTTAVSLDNVQRLSFYAIYDGHAGVRAAQFAANVLHKKLAHRIPRMSFQQFEKDVKRIFIDVYKETDAEFLKMASKERPHWKDGSTASTVLVIDNTLYVANIGDSKVILARESDDAVVTMMEDDVKSKESKLQPICLTVDHNPQDYAERQRIQRTGSVVRDGRVSGILEVSRSFGDYQFKKQGVSCVPDIRKCTLTEKDKFVIIGCDGLWKSLTPPDAIALCRKFIPTNPCDLTEQEFHSKVEEACSALANEAVLKLSGDNVSVIVIAVHCRLL